MLKTPENVVSILKRRKYSTTGIVYTSDGTDMKRIDKTFSHWRLADVRYCDEILACQCVSL